MVTILVNNKYHKNDLDPVLFNFAQTFFSGIVSVEDYNNLRKIVKTLL